MLNVSKSRFYDKDWKIAQKLTIKTSNLSSELNQFAVSIKTRFEYKHARVEAVRPADIWSCW